GRCLSTHVTRRALATIATLFRPNIAALKLVNSSGRVVELQLGRSNSPGIWGQANLKTRYRSALVAALACASALAITLAVEPAAARGAKGAKPATKPAGKATKARGKKAPGKSRGKPAPEKSAVPQTPLAHGPPPQTAAADIALVKSGIEALRHGGASKATEVAGTISDPVARKLVEWIVLRSDHSGADSRRFLGFIAASPR